MLRPYIDRPRVQPGRRAAATAPATLRTPSNVSRAAISRGVCTTRAVLQSPRMIVTHSRAVAPSTSPSTTTGSQRARLASRARATRSTVAPSRWIRAIVVPRSSMPSKLTTIVSASRLARSPTRARAPSRPYSSASGKITPMGASGGRASTVASAATTPAALSTAPADRSVTRLSASKPAPAAPVPTSTPSTIPGCAAPSRARSTSPSSSATPTAARAAAARRAARPAVQPRSHEVHRHLPPRRTELGHDLLVQRHQALLQASRPRAVAGPERRENTGADPGGEARHGEHSAVAPQLEGRIQERAGPDEHGPAGDGIAVGGEVLGVSRRVFDPNDVGVARELLQQGGRDGQVCVLGDIVHEHRNGTRLGNGAIVVDQARGRDRGRIVARPAHHHPVGPLPRGRPREGHRPSRGFGPPAGPGPKPGPPACPHPPHPAPPPGPP